MSTNKEYKTTKKYDCPYCNYRATRIDLIDHIDKNHKMMIPENYTATRVMYEAINHKDHGTCMVCSDPIFEWDEKISRYKNLCGKQSCKTTLRKKALENHIKVYNKPTLLDDPKHQEEMLAHRKISGTYTFNDGGSLTYTGSYERKLLEFMDKVLNIESKDIMAPGPTFEYNFHGEKHIWITDVYYIPTNLVIEVKDGGDNPNTRSMPIYREKQIAKEEMITAKQTYNYLRLTNNNFDQLLQIFADMKYDIVEDGDSKVKIKINECGGLANGPAGGLPPAADCNPDNVYITPFKINNDFDDKDINVAISCDTMGERAIIRNTDGILEMTDMDYVSSYPHVSFKINSTNRASSISRLIKNIIKQLNNTVDENFIINTIFEGEFMTLDDMMFSDRVSIIKEDSQLCSMMETIDYYKNNYINKNKFALYSDAVDKVLNDMRSGNNGSIIQ